MNRIRDILTGLWAMGFLMWILSGAGLGWVSTTWVHYQAHPGPWPLFWLIVSILFALFYTVFAVLMMRDK